MTELIFQTDSYCKAFSASITAVDQASHAILLDRTAFYPGGGGQPYDTGSVSYAGKVLPLVRGRKGPEGIWHTLVPEAALPPVGASVEGTLDWEQRYQLMRTHTAMHILCGTIFRDYHAMVTGGDMDPLAGRMDFEFETLSKDLVGVIEASVNREVAAARPVKVQMLPRQQAFQIPDLIRTKINLLPAGIEEVRIVEIVGLDLQADGGTHVANTSEVGKIRVVDYKSKGRINKRIYLELG
jgi:misacylated tRNA(Ala) deacylase